MGMSVSDQVRKALVDSGISRYRVSKDLGISQAQLSKFVNRKAGLSVGALDRLCEFLGLEVRAKADRPSRPTPAKRTRR
jgi:transcriptional regulator with XRE-family HTH domain